MVVEFKPIQSDDSSKIKLTVIVQGTKIIWTTRRRVIRVTYLKGFTMAI